MRKILIIVLLFGVQLLDAQSLKVADTIINGKKYWVYPYVFRNTDFYRDNESYFTIPPILESLPDGDYVLYQRAEKKQIVKCLFPIQNGLINGEAVFLGTEGELLSKGLYKEGLKTGKWNGYSDHGVLLQEENYLEGKLHGRYQHVGVVDGEYINGKKEGEWRYYKNGYLAQLQNYKDGKLNGVLEIYKRRYSGNPTADNYCKYRVQCKNDSISGLFQEYDINPDDQKIYLAREFYTNDKNLLTHHHELTYNTKFHELHPKTFYNYYKCWYPNEQLIFEAKSDNIDSLKYGVLKENQFYSIGFTQYIMLPKKSAFVLYYPNGKKWKYYNSKEIIPLSNDTIFWKTGLSSEIHVPIADTLNSRRYILNVYDRNGNMAIQAFHIEVSPNLFEIYRYHVFNNDNGILSMIDNTYFIQQENRPKTDTTISLMSKYIDGNGEYVSKYYCASSANTAYFRENKNGKLVDFEILSFYPVIHYYQKVVCDGVTFITYSSGDKAYKWANTSSRTLFYDNSLYQLDLEFGFGDSTIVMVGNKRFTGKLIQKKENLKKHRVVAFNKIYWKPSPQDKGANEQVFYFKEGTLQMAVSKSKEAGMKTMDTCSFQNNRMEGRRVRIEENFMGRSKEVSHFHEGYLEGKFEEYIQGLGIHLTESRNYKRGIEVDTSLVYDVKGSIVERKIFDKNGKREGLQYRNMLSGRSYKTYSKDLLNGLSYDINASGDTIYCVNYINDEKEGLEYSDQNYTWYTKGNIDSMKNYKENHIIEKFICSLDQYKEFRANYHYFSIDPFSGLCGELTTYFKNGKPYSIGKYKAEKNSTNKFVYHDPFKSFKVGEWKYYREDGTLKSTVNYDLIFRVEKGKPDTTHFLGTYSEYYPSGKLKYKGDLLSESKENYCETGIKEMNFKVNYSYYVSEKGDTLVKKGNGKLQVFNDNNVLISEVEMLNGKYNGWWKAYNNQGKIIEIGKYVNGKKEGRWLEGDLTGINYLDEKCFQSETEKATRQSTIRYLYISEKFYENDKMISSTYHNFTQSK